jgi:hypothetical protein
MLCPYDEEEPALWFRLIEVQFAAAGIRTLKLKYVNTLANFPKQIFWDILFTVDATTPSTLLRISKPFVFGQFGKSKW